MAGWRNRATRHRAGFEPVWHERLPERDRPGLSADRRCNERGSPETHATVCIRVLATLGRAVHYTVFDGDKNSTESATVYCRKSHHDHAVCFCGQGRDTLALNRVIAFQPDRIARTRLCACGCECPRSAP